MDRSFCCSHLPLAGNGGCAERWRIIKGNAPVVAVLNYTEGSIVSLSRLPQITERFKEAVGGGAGGGGGGSRGLWFCSASSAPSCRFVCLSERRRLAAPPRAPCFRYQSKVVARANICCGVESFSGRNVRMFRRK